MRKDEIDSLKQENDWLKRALAEYTGSSQEIHRYIVLRTASSKNRDRTLHSGLGPAYKEAKRLHGLTGEKFYVLKVKKIVPKEES